MASDYFLFIEGIKGESQDSKHANEIEIESFSMGLSNPGNPVTGGGGGVGKVSFQDLHFTMKTNKASTSLFLACASGTHIKEAVLTVRKAGGSQQDYYKVTLNDLLVTSYNSEGNDTLPASESGDTSVPTDQFSLNFSKVEFAVNTLDEAGRPAEGTTVGWDLKRNQKV